MTPEFYAEYLKASQNIQRLLYAMNPNKFRTCEKLMNFHEGRGHRSMSRVAHARQEID